MKNYLEFASQIAILDDNELLDLANRCKSLYNDRERIKRDELRMQLMGNLQKAIGDILHNGFNLAIKNTECDPKYDDYVEVFFEPEDIYSIVIVDTK